MSTAACLVASAASHRVCPRGVAPVTRASSSSPASGTPRAGSEKTRSVGGVGTVVSRRRRVAPVHASAAPATRTSEDHDDDDAFSSHGDGDTIVAIATPVVPQAGGVAIIRLSGPSAVSAAMSVFRPASRAAREDALSLIHI